MMTVLQFTSDHSPALAAFNGRLYLAWKGNDNLNVSSSTDGQNWDPQIMFDEFTPHGPALASFNGRLYIGWTGTDEFALLNVMSTDDGVNWGNKVTIREDSQYGPALCAFDGKLYIAWTGVDELSLVNLLSSSDGTTWGGKVTLRENSIASPALAAVQDPGADAPFQNVLYLSWTGTDNPNHLNLLSSIDGANFGDKMILNADRLVGQEATSFAGPALATRVVPDPTYQGFIYPTLDIAWTKLGDDSELMTVPYPQPNQDYQLIINQSVVEYLDTSIAAPALAEFGTDVLYIAWAGADDEHHLNVANAAVMQLK